MILLNRCCQCDPILVQYQWMTWHQLFMETFILRIILKKCAILLQQEVGSRLCSKESGSCSDLAAATQNDHVKP